MLHITRALEGRAAGAGREKAAAQLLREAHGALRQARIPA
jgi:hypothetical protein